VDGSQVARTIAVNWPRSPWGKRPRPSASPRSATATRRGPSPDGPSARAPLGRPPRAGHEWRTHLCPRPRGLDSGARSRGYAVARIRSARGIREQTPRIRGVAAQGPGPRGRGCGHALRARVPRPRGAWPSRGKRCRRRPPAGRAVESFPVGRITCGRTSSDHATGPAAARGPCRRRSPAGRAQRGPARS